ncbi:MAG: LTA synthase family protein [Eubacterium sp.]|nr:LTA synthase family protein [Eubacterium sp.]
MKVVEFYKSKNALTQILWILIYLLAAAVFLGGLALYLFYPLIPKYLIELFPSMKLDQVLVSLRDYDYTTLSPEVLALIQHKLKVLAVGAGCFALLLLFCINFVFPRKNGKRFVLHTKPLKRVTAIVLAAFSAWYGFSTAAQDPMFTEFVKAYFEPSGFIAENYVDPETATVVFPEKKRNLIHIYLESMENSFLSEEYGGYMQENLLPHLTELSYSGTVFSDNDGYFGGAVRATGADWSVASMVNQTSGLPHIAPGYKNYYGEEGKYLPGAYTLGEMLEKEGYEQTVMFGATARFAKLQYYYQTHGNWKIFDYDYARDNGYIPADYKVFWGFEDEKLFDFAKEEITRLYETGKPFNFTMETADSHYPNGYLSSGDEEPFGNAYANAVYNSDRRVAAFVEWLQAQPFYENTTVVLIGDHLSMAGNFFEYYEFDDSYLRTQYNCILNPDPSVLQGLDESKTRNRSWANWDYFPTIVASLGATVEGDRLGIGTNLFSGSPTVFEQYGVDAVNEELTKLSPLYVRDILEVKNPFDAVYLNNY